MAALPTSSKIPVLTVDNIMGVSQVYLNQLCNGKAVNASQAEDFIWEAMQKLRVQHESSRLAATEAISNIDHLLKRIPHVRGTCLYPFPAGLEDWLISNEIGFDVIAQGSELIFLFESYDDSLLFKLRWS